jgi:hypothetical protein
MPIDLNQYQGRLAKAIDEYNQVNITIPEMQKRGKRKS